MPAKPDKKKANKATASATARAPAAESSSTTDATPAPTSAPVASPDPTPALAAPAPAAAPVPVPVANGADDASVGNGSSIPNGSPKPESILESEPPKFTSTAITFRIQYVTNPGEYLLVCGSTSELGSWKIDQAKKMKWTPDHFWVAEITVPSDAAFEYKYVAKVADGYRWETTKNRKIALKGDKDSLKCDEAWESFRIRFSIYYPLTPPENLYMTGDPPQIGGWFNPGPTKLTLGPVEVLPTGEKGKCWELHIFLPVGSFTSIQYRYLIMNEKTKTAIWEREPNRRLELEEAQVVNGVIETKDVNFVGGLLFDKIQDNIYIGPYPQTKKDLETMKEAGVTAVFDVQTDEDKKHRQIDWPAMLAAYQETGIELCRYQIQDFSGDSLKENLRGATHKFEDLIKRGQKIYVHCTAGMGRAPAVVVAYLAWCENYAADDALKYVRDHRPVCFPNMGVIGPLVKESYNL